MELSFSQKLIRMTIKQFSRDKKKVEQSFLKMVKSTMLLVSNLKKPRRLSSKTSIRSQRPQLKARPPSFFKSSQRMVRSCTSLRRNLRSRLNNWDLAMAELNFWSRERRKSQIWDSMIWIVLGSILRTHWPCSNKMRRQSCPRRTTKKMDFSSHKKLSW